MSKDQRTPSIAALMALRLSRRKVLKGLVAINAALAAPIVNVYSQPASGLTFDGLAHGVDEQLHVPPGYDAQVLMRWGDPVYADAPVWDPYRLSAQAQRKQFGTNNDFVAYFPLPLGGVSSDWGLLCVNHEFTDTDFMWPTAKLRRMIKRLDPELVEVELAAHGLSIVEIRRDSNGWQAVEGGSCNRRITAQTLMRLSGPAAGHMRLRTADDPTGTKVVGMLNNCSGGRTPWGTVLTAEENFHLYFAGDPAATPQAELHQRYHLGQLVRYYWWGKLVPRFDMESEPNEPNRFGWVVEIDPYDPNDQPVKRTALGRMAHESATTVVDPDGRVIVYTGDDAAGEYLYKFVSNGRFNAEHREANRDLLDDGVLYVARFDADGGLRWLPLVAGSAPLTPENGFAGQGDVLIQTRRAADLLGATPMDRPEDIEVHPGTGTVIVNMTGNEGRRAQDVDAANPRPINRCGHVIALMPARDAQGRALHAADYFNWEIVILAGDPDNPKDRARYHPDIADGGWFVRPDNCGFDPSGNLWIATDRAQYFRTTNCSDGLWACSISGNDAYLTKCFLLAPIGSEVCSPEFTPDGTTLFVSIQHPGIDGWTRPTYEQPSTRWPDFDDNIPPRSAVVAIRKKDGGRIGS
jgi:secreted PhoX family phosphatase